MPASSPREHAPAAGAAIVPHATKRWSPRVPRRPSARRGEGGLHREHRAQPHCCHRRRSRTTHRAAMLQLPRGSVTPNAGSGVARWMSVEAAEGPHRRRFVLVPEPRVVPLTRTPLHPRTLHAHHMRRSASPPPPPLRVRAHRRGCRRRLNVSAARLGRGGPRGFGPDAEPGAESTVEQHMSFVDKYVN